MTLTAQVKSATAISVVWAQIGPSAARSHHALLETVTVMRMQNVKAPFCVAKITVKVVHLIWTAVAKGQTLLTIPFVLKKESAKRVRVAAIQIWNVMALLSVDQTIVQTDHTIILTVAQGNAAMTRIA